SDAGRWAFETQIAFLTFKGNEIRDALNRGIRIIVDRSLEEDIFVFAKHFRDTGELSERGHQTYSAVAEQYLSLLPRPDLLIHCRCDASTALRRIAERHRSVSV